jgi:hypothetical protein
VHDVLGTAIYLFVAVPGHRQPVRQSKRRGVAFHLSAAPRRNYAAGQACRLQQRGWRNLDPSNNSSIWFVSDSLVTDGVEMIGCDGRLDF